MMKTWAIEPSSAVGGLLEILSDFGIDVNVNFSTKNNPNFWEITVSAPANFFSEIEDVIAPYV